MIDARELRIGNLLQSPTGWIGSVIELKSSFVRLYEKDDLSAYNFGSDLIDPIPITPEWLERLGFVRTRDLIHTAEFVLLGGPCIHILFSKIDGRLYLGESFITRSGDDEDEFIAVPLTFIHQVHNLHFALTGEELTIKQ